MDRQKTVLITNLGIEKYLLFILGVFTLWPFVGLTTVVYPLADVVAIGFYLLGLFLFIKDRGFYGSIIWGFALLTHKAIWVFIALSFFGLYLVYFKNKFLEWIKLGLIIITPIIVLWVAGSFYHHDFLWLISSNLNVEFQSKSTLPIMDGLIGTLLSGGMRAFVKGGLILFVLALSIILIYVLLKKKFSYWQIGIAICLSVLILIVGLNQSEIWASVRFGRLLVIPMAFVFPFYFEKIKLSTKLINILTYTSLFALYLSQFAFAYYMAKVFFK